MKRPRPRRRKVLIGSVLVLVALAGIGVGTYLLGTRAGAPKAKAVVAAPKSVQPAPIATTQPAPAAFDKSRYSTTDASSLWVIVNKKHPLSPLDYAPADLTTAYGHQVSARLVPDVSAMVTDAAKDGASITLVSTYRSYTYQVSLYNSYVASDGQAKADTYSARPGYSEHQTGLAIDFGNRAGICTIEPCFSDTKEGAWLAANAWKYGFLLRYTAAKQSVTGYEAEAWHYRYVGRDLAAELHRTGTATLEEFFGIEGGDYN